MSSWVFCAVAVVMTNVAWGACDVRKAVQWWEKMRAEDRRAMG